MTAESTRLARHFAELSELPADRRAALLAEIRAETPALAAELESLLAAHDAADGFLEQLDATRATELLEKQNDAARPERAGAFRLVREIGRGGLGVVYLGERDTGDFRQRVAVKLIKRGMDSDLIIRRFHHERRILASLEHPNIARLIDGGLLDDGRPYFAMEYIEGTPITTWCDRERADIDRRLRLFEDICRAVQHAHARLIVHRDLKPANLLVTDNGEVKLLDFGIAKLLDDEIAGNTALTVAGAGAMTPEYAAPEQIRGDPVSAATDVYALGVVLYELLAGNHPFRDGVATREGLARAICDTSPALPSAVVTGARAGPVAESRNSRPKSLKRRLHGDLDNIVLTAMAKEPGRRYGSAEALAEDVRRHLQGMPVKARRETLSYRAGRFLYRHHLGVAATTAVMLALTGGLAAALWQAGKAREQAEIALRSKDFVVSLIIDTNPVSSEAGAELKAVDLLRHSVTRVETELDETPALQADLRAAIAEALLDLGAQDEALPLAERAVEQLRAVYGTGSSQLVVGLYRLARIQANLGQPDRAEASAREALAILERRNAPADIVQIRLWQMLGIALNLRGRHDEAMALYGRALEAVIESEGADSSSLIAIYNNLASSAIRAERYREAEAAFQQAKRVLLIDADEEHPYMSYILVGVGAALTGQGDLQQAEAVLTRALRLAEQRFGADSARVISPRSHLGRLRLFQGRTAEAAELLADAAARADARGSRREEAECRLWLGLALIGLGQAEAAGRAFRRADELWAESDGERLPQHGLTQVGLGLILAAEGRAEAGQALAEAALADMQARGHDHGRYYGEAASLYARLLEQAGDGEQARLWRTRSSTVFTAVLGEHHPRTQASLAWDSPPRAADDTPVR